MFAAGAVSVIKLKILLLVIARYYKDNARLIQALKYAVSLVISRFRCFC